MNIFSLSCLNFYFYQSLAQGLQKDSKLPWKRNLNSDTLIKNIHKEWRSGNDISS